MKIFKSALLVLSIMTFSFSVQAQDATELMRQAHELYGKRFDSSGRYLKNPQLLEQFIALQNSNIQKIKSAGLATKSFKIYNNAMSNIVITVILVQEKDARLAGLIIERSQYDSREAEGLLRLYNLPILAGGMTAFSFGDAGLVSLKSEQLTASNGGAVFIKYPTNYKNNIFEQARFEILKTTGGDFNFFTNSKQWFSRVDLSIWTQIFAGNFGIESVTFK